MKDTGHYAAIDLKSFYASVECVERGLDPLNTNLVVADSSRTEKTICLAVSPSLKAAGVPGRPRLFEVNSKVNKINAQRQAACRRFTGTSFFADELKNNPSLKLDFIIAKPRMTHYIEYSKRIYEIYLRFVSPEDIHVYSIDEVFIDLRPYLSMFGAAPYELTRMMIGEVLRETGITATAGIGTNLYLCKVAMDILAKKMPPDEDGVRIAELDELSYREKMWSHRPLTDFWRIGRGYSNKLQRKGLFTMGDIARCSIGPDNCYYNEDLLYRMFGKNAELLIDHAWGYEPCTMQDIRSYKPTSRSLSSGQVLQEAYTADKAKLVTWEMADILVLDLADKGFVTNQIVLTIGYDIENIDNPAIGFAGPVKKDYYGRKVPKHAHGTFNLKEYTSSTEIITDAAMELFDKIVNPDLLVRRISISACKIMEVEEALREKKKQITIFDIAEEKNIPIGRENRYFSELKQKKERELQRAMLSIKKKYGKNALIKGANLEEGATAKSRNSQIGGHKA